MHYDKESLGSFIEMLSAEYAERTAVTYYHGYRRYQYSYAELSHRAHNVGAYLYDLGLAKGDRVLVCGANCPEWTALLLACGLTGVVLVPVDVGSSPDLVQTIAKLTEPTLIVTDRTDLQAVAVAGALRLDELFAVCQNVDAHALGRHDVHIGRDDLLEIVYTSGTTSQPKGVMLTHGNVVANLRALRLSLQYNPSWRFLSLLPLSHMLEQTVGCLAPLRFGCELVYHKRKSSMEVREIIRAHGISCIVAVPVVLRTMRRRIEEGADRQGSAKQLEDLMSKAGRLPVWLRRQMTRPVRRRLGAGLTAFICGGGPLDLESEEFFEKLGVRVIQGYGLTEAAPIVTCNSYERRVPGSVGRVLKEQQLRLAADGEILIAGANVTSGYFCQPELSAAYFEEGWYRTGDIGKLDDEGNLQIIGRKKNMLVGSSGMNIYPEDIEEKLARQTQVVECVVFSQEQEDRLRLCAAIVAEEGAIDVDQLRAAVNRTLEPHQRLDAIFVWPGPEFPKTPTRKILRQEVIDRYRQAGAAGSSSAGAAVAPVDKTVALVARIAGVDEAVIQPQMRLREDIGLDSLQIAQLAIECENHFCVELDEAELAQHTVATLKHAVTFCRFADRAPRRERDRSPSRLNASACMCIRSILEVLVLRVVFGVRLRRRTPRMPRCQSPVIYVANHQGHLDTPAVLSTLPVAHRDRIAVAAAGDYFFDGAGLLKRQVARLLHLFSFSRGSGMRKNMTTIGRLLDRGFSVLIYPEGSRSRDGSLQPFRTGIGHIVREMGVPVVPIHIDGSFDVLPAGRTVPSRGTIDVAFGEPLRLGDQCPEAITAALRDAVVQLSKSAPAQVIEEVESYV